MSNPDSPKNAPDPARSYERAKPEHESGMGRMDNNVSTPTHRADQMHGAVGNKQDPQRQVNGEELNAKDPRPAAEQPDHSMKEEEPLGWDQAPLDIEEPEQKRHPRTEGRGGV